MATDVRGNPEAALVALYRSLAQDLGGLLGQARKGASDAFVAEQLRALAVELNRLGDKTAAWAAAEASSAYRASAGAAATTLQRMRLPMIAPGFTGVDKRAVDALATRMNGSLADYREALGRGLVLGDPRIGARAVRQVLEGSNKLVEVSAGVVRVQVGDKKWAPDAYASTVARTGIAQTRREAFRQRYVQNGFDVVRVVANGSDHPACQVWEGERLSLTGETEGLPTVDDAEAAGLFHPNCRHRYVVDTTWPLPTDEEREATRAAAEADDEEPETAGSRRPTESRQAQAIAEAQLPPVAETIQLGQALDDAAMNFLQIPQEVQDAVRRGLAGESVGFAIGKAQRATSFDHLEQAASAARAAGQPSDDLYLQRYAVEYYAGNGFSSLNKSLRTGAEMDPIQTGYVDRIDAAIAGARPLDVDVIAWRGMNTERAPEMAAAGINFAALRTGDVFSDAGFGSWSARRDVAEEFSVGRLEAAVVVRMRMRAGTRAFYVGPDEAELILSRDARYRVVSDERGVVLTHGRVRRVLTVEKLEE